MLTLPKPLIKFIASFLNATNTIALRSTCKRFSFLPLNHFRLCLKSSFSFSHSSFSRSEKEGKKEGKNNVFTYIQYTGFDYANDLRGCEIKKLWLVYPTYIPFHSTTKIHTLVVDTKYWDFFDFPKIISYDPHDIKKFNYSKKYKDCSIENLTGYYRGKNLYMHTNAYYYSDIEFEEKSITDFKKIVVREDFRYFDQRIKKLAIRNYLSADLTILNNLTHLYLYYIETNILLPPNIRVLKLNFIIHNKVGPLPKSLKKLKLKYCATVLINSIQLPPSVDWYKITVDSQKKKYLCSPQTENLNLTYICKYI